MKLFVDLDGVLADFDQHYEDNFGERPNKVLDTVDWELINQTPNFYRHIPVMSDAFKLWTAIEHLRPTILTGIPSSIQEASHNKREWVKTHFGHHVPVITCRSKEKCKHAEPGSILIDDWEKYRNLWEGAGGVWITHLNADTTLDELRKKGVVL